MRRYALIFVMVWCKYTFEKTEGVIKKGQSRETDSIEYAGRRKHNTIYVVHHYSQTNANNVNKTCTLLQTNGNKDKPNTVLCTNRNGHHNTELST